MYENYVGIQKCRPSFDRLPLPLSGKKCIHGDFPLYFIGQNFERVELLLDFGEREEKYLTNCDFFIPPKFFWDTGEGESSRGLLFSCHWKKMEEIFVNTYININICVFIISPNDT